MTEISMEQEIITEVHKLSHEQQRQVLQYVQLLTASHRPKGEPGWKMVQAAREINFPKEDLEEMAQAIEEWCERVDDFPEVDLDG